MAKKSSKSMKGFLFDFLVLVLAGGLLGFLALPFMKYQTTAFCSSDLQTSIARRWKVAQIMRKTNLSTSYSNSCHEYI